MRAGGGSVSGAPDIGTARAMGLGQRLSPEWQDEDVLLRGLSAPNIQHFAVTRSGLAERRRIGGTRAGVPVRWQLRLKA
jgi:hypothetical protein